MTTDDRSDREKLRDYMALCLEWGAVPGDAFDVIADFETRARADERAKIAAWLREQWLTPQELAGQIESGEYAK